MLDRLRLQLLAVCLCLVLAAGPPAASATDEPFGTFTRDDAIWQAAVEVDASRPAAGPIPATLFGTFTENIWDAVYGGVWAQVLHNPSFEPDYLSVQSTLDASRYGRLVTDPSFGSGYVRVEPLLDDPAAGRFARSSALGLPVPWEPLRPNGVRYEPRFGDAPNSTRALLVMGLAEQEVGVRQGIYLPSHRTSELRGSLWAKPARQGQAPRVTVSLRRRDRPDDIIATTEIAAGTPGWVRHEFHLRARTGSVAPLERLDFCLSVAGEERVLLDNVLLWPGDAVEGFDPEVLEAARALRTPLLRFGGNFVSGYHWRDGVGPLERRPTILNQAWGLPEYNHFGTDEFIRLCRLIGAEPQISVNAGSGEADEAAAWVEYCNGPATSTYGAMRAANGHPEPYNVRYWEVGNELWGTFQIGWQTPASNAARYLEFARAMRRADPTIRLIATGADVDFYQEWNGALLGRAASELDLISTHLVIGMQPGEQLRRGADDTFTHAADFAVPVAVGRALDAMRGQVDGAAGARGRVRFAFTEWQFWSPRPEDPRFTNLGGAVNAAAFFHMLARRADFVPVSNMSNLVHFAGIHRQRGRVFVAPSYHVLRLYRGLAGMQPVPTRVRAPAYDVREGNRRTPDVPNVPVLDAFAAIGPDGDELRLFLVNRSGRALETSTLLRSFAPGRTVLREIGGQGLGAANSPEEPDRVGVTTREVPGRSPSLTLVLPAYSVTELEFSRRRSMSRDGRGQALVSAVRRASGPVSGPRWKK